MYWSKNHGTEVLCKGFNTYNISYNKIPITNTTNHNHQISSQIRIAKNEL